MRTKNQKVLRFLGVVFTLCVFNFSVHQTGSHASQVEMPKKKVKSTAAGRENVVGDVTKAEGNAAVAADKESHCEKCHDKKGKMAGGCEKCHEKGGKCKDCNGCQGDKCTECPGCKEHAKQGEAQGDSGADKKE